MLLRLDEDDLSQVLIIEGNIVEVALLIAADLLADNYLLEIDHTVFDLDVALRPLLHDIVTEVLHIPSHVGVLLHDLINELLLRVVEILEALLDVVLNTLLSEWRKVGVGHDLFKVAELMLLVPTKVDCVVVLLSEHVLVMVPLQEWVYPLDEGSLDDFGVVEHDEFLVALLVLIEDVLEEQLDGLVLVKLDRQSDSRHEVKVNLDHLVLLAQLDLSVVIYLFLISHRYFINQ